MHPIRVVRRLLSRAHEDWQDAVEGLFSAPPTRRPIGPRPLRVMRLERRRVLSADFSLTATGLVLSGFDDAGGDTLTVQQEGDAYQFTSASGWEQHEPGQMPEGVTIDGDTLSVDRAVLEGLEDGLTIEGSLGHQLDVRLGDADFSSLSGPVTLAGATAVGQDSPFALFTAPTEGFQLIVAPAGTVLSSINVSGDLNIISIGGSITDSPGSEILISGNATFTSRAASPAGDFNGDGLVNQTDYSEHWAKNYGMTSGATKYQGDANGDGRVDAADYTLWRDTVGQTGQGGIELANQAGDRLVIGGVATFDAAEPQGTHDIYVGVGGVAEFGSINAYGANVIIHEDATTGDSGPTTVLGNIEAYSLQVESGGKITDTPTAQIIVNGDASFTVTKAARIADGSLVQAIVLADGTGDNRLEIGGMATFVVERHLTQVPGFTGPKGIDVGVATNGQAAAAVFNAGSLRFNAPGATVRLAEDSSTILAGWASLESLKENTAHTLELQSTGDIRDNANAIVRITGVNTDGSPDPTASAAFYTPGSIVLTDEGSGNVLSIDGLATFIGTNVDVGVASSGVAAASTFNAGSLRFSSFSGVTRLAEDSDTVLVGWSTTPAPQAFTLRPTVNSARALEVTSAGSITDADDFYLEVGALRASGPNTNATFVAKDTIVLADGASTGNSIGVNGVATFISTDGDEISVGIGADDTPAGAFFNAGSLRFVSVGGDVRIAEDSDTLLADWAPISIAPSIPLPTPTASVAGNLELLSIRSITDESNAVVNVTGNATFVAGFNITLADVDNVGTVNALTVGGVASFLVGPGRTVQVGAMNSGLASPAMFQAGSLRFFAPNGIARIAEDDGTHFADWMTVPLSPLVATPPMATSALNLQLSSAGSITDAPDAVVFATGWNGANRVYNSTANATFVAAESITLADGGIGNALMVDGVATFVSTTGAGQRIDIGVTPTGGVPDGQFIAGSIRFSAPLGSVRVVEVATINVKGEAYSENRGTVIGSWGAGPVSPFVPATVVSNQAGTLEILSFGAITDDENAVVVVTGNAGFRVFGVPADAPNNKSILLADGSAGNTLSIGGAATFVVEGARGIDVGVTPEGTAAAAQFNAGSLRFNAAGAVRIAEDNATQLDAWNSLAVGLIRPDAAMNRSVVGTLDLYSAGSITDASDAAVVIADDATLQAAGSITLADGGALNSFTVGDLATFVQSGAFFMRLGVDGSNAPDAATFNTGRLRFYVGSGQARIAEDSGVVFAGWEALPPIVTTTTNGRTTAGDLAVAANGSITDESMASIDVFATALFVATQDIVLADSGDGSGLSVAARSAFVAGAGGKIDVGMTAAGTPATATFNAGSLLFSAPQGVVRIAEDSGALIDAWSNFSDAFSPTPPQQNVANVLELYSAGSVRDIASTQMAIADDATIVAADDIVLADAGAANTFTVGDLATFVAGQSRLIAVGVDSGFNFSPAAAVFTAERLRFAATNGTIGVAVDDSTLLAGWPMGSTSPLLGNTPPMATEAKTIEIFSAGSITDAADAVIIATGRNSGGARVYDPTASATFVAAQSITLADASGENRLIVDGAATFVSVTGAAQVIDVGVTGAGVMAGAQFIAGSIRFSASGGAVRLVEDPSAAFKSVVYAETPGTVLAGWGAGTVSPLVPASVNRSAAASLELVSIGPITDAANAVVEVTGAAGFRVIGTAIPNDGTVSIRLADADSDNRLIVGGAATFVVDGTRGIDVGVTPTGTPAAAEFTAGSLRFASLGAVRIAEDNATHLAGWGDLPVGLIRQASGVSFSQAQTLELLSTQSITDASGAQLRVIDDATFISNGGNSAWAIDLADSPNDNQLLIGDLATFIVTAENAGIRVGVTAGGTPASAGFTAGRLRFSAPTGDVQIAEDASTTIGGVVNDAMRGTALAGWTTDAVSPLLVTPAPTISQAKSLAMVSAGQITDATDAIIDVTVDAGFLVTDAAAISVNNLAIRLADSDSTSTVNRLTVGGFATFVTLGGGGIEIGDTPRSGPAEATFNAGALRFFAPNAQVRIAEDSGTSLAKATTDGVLGLGGPLPASVAGSLGLTSNGVISDESAAQVEVTGNASFIVSSIANVGDDRAIVLANSGGDNRLTVGGLAFFQVVQQPSDLAPKGIDIGIAADGTPTGAVFMAGRLAFDAAGGSVRIAEDDGTVLAGRSSQAGELQLLSTGAIVDEAIARLQLTGNATIVSALGTTLADDFADNQLSVGGLATFVVGANQTLAVGTPATGTAAGAAFNAGSLRFFAPNGTARIAEDSATEFVDWMMVAPSPLIAMPPMAIEAKTIEVFSAGSITDTPTAVIIATGNIGGVRSYDQTASATFVAANSITLADGDSANKLIVDGRLTLVSTTNASQQIHVGMTDAGVVAAAEFVAGSVRFSASGDVVRIGEDASATYKTVTYSETPGTHIAGWTSGTVSALIMPQPPKSEAATLVVTSAGTITDAEDAKVDVTGAATFTVNTIAHVSGLRAITLADSGAANELTVDGYARFIVEQAGAGANSKGIDVGVNADGTPAMAVFTAGTLGFSAEGGLVRMAEDNDTVLGGASEAHDLELLSAGAITDTIGSEANPTSVEVTQSALLKAGLNGENDVALGAGLTAKFSMLDREGSDPDLFSNDQYLAVQARNVSIRADSGINVRTGDAPLSNLNNYSQFAGTFYLAAKGSVTQSTTETPKALAADKISVASDNGAVLLRLVKPTGAGTDPNLQIKAGGSVALTQVTSGDTVKSRFETSDIPSTTNSKFAPVIIEADDPTTGARSGVAMRPGVNNVFEDLYASDSTGVHNARVSEAVKDAQGNVIYDHAIPDGSGGVRMIDDFYAVVVIVDGAAVVGDVWDPNINDRHQADAKTEAEANGGRGIVVGDAGNAFIATLDGGNLDFTNRNREGQLARLDGIAVQMAGGVFTAVAAGTLRIDTEDPDNLADNLRTTRLVSKTGTVTNVGAGEGYGFGPRAILDSPTEEGNAATSGLVRADQDFEQRITMALGSRGEKNILVEVEWADVADIREYSNANVRLPADPNLDPNIVDDNGIPGSQQYADLVQAPRDAIEENGRSADYDYQLASGITRVATITHNYDEAFVPNNPAQNRLPTTVRVFNDSAINLFDQGGARNLNSVSFSIAPRIITVPPSGFFIISTPDLPERYEPVSVTLPRAEPTQVTQQTTSDDGRAVTVSSAEDVLYGRVDEKGEWIVDIPGESWPKVHEDAEGDFLREIRDKIDEGPYSKGRYVIKVVTPRSEQLLEEWVKGDDAEVAAEAGAKPAAAAPAEEAVLPAEGAQPATPVIDGPIGNGPVEAPAVVAPQGAPLGFLELESAPSDARQVAFAAMAAVGVWRRRLNEAGPFTLDADGVAFTRVKRQRRRRGGE